MIISYSFKELEEMKVYKNKHTYNDQMYLKYNNKLYTFSKYSNGKLSTSSACRYSKSFVDINTKLKSR
jgi:hypothetical protein